MILCNVSFAGKILCKPTEARTILPAFTHILERASEHGHQSEQAHLFYRNEHIVPYFRHGALIKKKCF